MNILMVSAEWAPLAKVGGLADAVAGLADALSRRGHDVRIVLPLYGHLDPDAEDILPLKELPAWGLRTGQKVHPVRIHQRRNAGSGADVYFVECPALFGGAGIYADADGLPFADPLARVSLHAQAALLLPRLLDWPVDIVHAHDAHAAMALVYRRLWFAGQDLPGPGGTVLTIHNLAHQEIHPVSAAQELGLPPAQAVYPGILEFNGAVNLMKAGILAADYVNTVSPTYAAETLNDPAMGCGLENVLAECGTRYGGILNGADYVSWDPGQDPALKANFSAGDPAGRVLCRVDLRTAFGLDVGADRPICGFVGRLVMQKGVDLLVPLLERLAGDGFGFAILGTGDAAIEESLAQAAAALPGNVGFVRGFDDALARKIYAGCDLFLMPSLYEPCGLGQMYALRYGALPVVRRTGGLADTVSDAADVDGVGFVFEKARPDALLAVLRRAGELWIDRTKWARLQDRGMRRVFDWDRAAVGYEEIYRTIGTDLGGGPTTPGGGAHGA